MSTRFEAFRSAMALQEVDQVPVMPTISGWVAKQCGIPFRRLIYDADAMAKAQLEAQRLTGIDALFAYFDSLVVPEAFGCEINFSLSVPAVEPIPINSAADVEALHMPDVHKSCRFLLTYSLIEKLAKAPGREVPIVAGMEGPFTTCARIFGVQKMMAATIKDRPLVEKLLDKVSSVVAEFAKTAEEFGADCLFLPDPVSSSSMISPKMYREMALPHVRRVLKDLKMPTILHVCGNTEPILDMMAETGANILNIDQCMDLGKAKQRVAGRCGVGGNVDPCDILLNGTVEDVKKETLKCLQQGGKDGYVLMAGCGVAPATPLENLRAMVDTAREA